MIEKIRNWALAKVGCPYVYGGTGQECTVAYRKARATQYPDFKSKIYSNCDRLSGRETSCHECKYFDNANNVGKNAYDCAQLTRYAMKQAGIHLVSGATSQWQKTKSDAKGAIASIPKDKLCLVFRQRDGRMQHVGLHLGDGTVVHARGHAYGVVRENFSLSSWTHYLVPSGLYSELEGVKQMQTVRTGSRGETVEVLQEMLNTLGFALTVDGIFGRNTWERVVAFQKMKGLKTDGIVGAMTWESLSKAVKDKEEGGEEDDHVEEALEIEEIKKALQSVQRVVQESLNKIQRLEKKLNGTSVG